jgi:Na+-transporting methylmalonyl-CoA/oxaloacetate decarboxylase gamma subunit
MTGVEGITNSINNFVPYIIIGMAIIILLLFIVVMILFKSVGNVEKRYRRLMRGVSCKNLEELINTKLDDVEEAKIMCEKALSNSEILQDRIKNCIQKVAIMRYKAFENVGSDLSFSIAILDDNNDGVLLTGIYAREESTTYAKPIDKGISRYDLSEEEIIVLNEAINKK